MNIYYDPEVDAAYIQLVGVMHVGGVAFTYGCDPVAVKGMIHLDFDADGRLLGIEVLGASTKLSEEILRSAERRV